MIKRRRARTETRVRRKIASLEKADKKKETK